jgi:DNA polymerase
MNRRRSTAAARSNKAANAPLVTGSAEDFIPGNPTLARLREAAGGCRGCELFLHATQTVFGEGPRGARVMLVGEQPGDKEDLAGHPFVGPAGQLLDAVLAEAGIERRRVYLTNAVKHFKFVRRELVKRRLHKPPTLTEMRACRPWLREEIRLLRPALVVALGSTAAKTLLGNDFSVMRGRGEPVQSEWAGLVLPTVHPSSILRAPSREDREQARKAFVEDIRKARQLLGPT